MKIWNQRGSALQIVLVLFMITSLYLLSVFTVLLDNGRGIQRAKQINTMRVIETSIIGYYKQEVLNGLLLSDSIVVEDYHVEYTIDDMGNYYIIYTNIESKQINYQFLLHLNLDTLLVTKFEYQ